MQPTNWCCNIGKKYNYREYWTKSWRANIAIFPMPSAQQELVVVATWLLDRQRCHPIISGMGQALIIDSPFPCIIKKKLYSRMQRGTWISILQGVVTVVFNIFSTTLCTINFNLRHEILKRNIIGIFLNRQYGTILEQIRSLHSKSK